jgi:DNA invertase Pin-like site-specific DNA recombinase
MQAGESESIQNQKLILQRYADEHFFLNTRFFVDDGFSGVSFEREGLQAMLREGEAGNVATVITKDLSRLGRNYLKTGELIEIIFPEYDVRYIAINDGVDTAREDNEFTPLRNWFNEFYARDTSKKIRAVKQAKAQRGERVNGEVPYGYIADPNDRNHLIPDPETAHVVKQIFAMYVRGDRMCEIQNWLRDNEVLTVGELRYRRKGGKKFPRPQLNAWYTWPDKTLYDILTRQEYLGHTITAKTYKVSYKSKKTRKNPEDKRYFFPNTHEPLIDEETFALAQKRIATRHRPTKSDEIDLFSGLLFCGDCGYKMYLQKGAGTPERKHAYTCGNYRNRARNDFLCTTHYIRKSILKELVLADLQRVLAYVKEHEQEFVRTAADYGEQAAKKALAQQKKELDKADKRLLELNVLFRKLYEDMALGRLSNEQFALLTSGYEDEKAALTKRAAEFRQEIDATAERGADVKRFVALVRRYSEISELTYENVHEFIDRILVHELNRETNTRKIEIFYSFVGKVDSGDEPTGSISYFRQIGADVKSFAV